MNNKKVTNREVLLSEGLLGRSTEKQSNPEISREVSSSLLAISTMALLVLSACSEVDREMFGEEVEEDAVQQDSYIDESFDTNNEVSDQEVDISPATYVFHNDGIYAKYSQKFENPVFVSVSFEENNELVVLESFITTDGVFNIKGIPNDVDQATMHYGQQSFTFKKDLIKDTLGKQLDEISFN